MEGEMLGAGRWAWCTSGEAVCACAAYKKTDLCRGCETRQDLYSLNRQFVGRSPVYKLRGLGENENACVDMNIDPVLEEVRPSPSAAQSSPKRASSSPEPDMSVSPTSPSPAPPGG